MPQIGNVYRFLSEGTTNKKEVKKGDGIIREIIAANLSAETRFVKLYDSSTEPALGTAKPILTIPVPKEDLRVISLESGVPFVKGLWHAITKKGIDTNEEATVAADVSLTLVT